MKKAHTIGFILAIFLLMFGCKKLEIVPALQNPIMPLEVGRYWNYKEYFEIDRNGTLFTAYREDVRWEIIEKGYQDIPNPENPGEDVRMEMFLMRSTRGNEKLYYLLRPVADGIFIESASTHNPGIQARSPVEPCAGLIDVAGEYLIKYPFPDSIVLQQSIWLGCDEFFPEDEAPLKYVQSLGPRVLVFEGLGFAIISGQGVEVSIFGNENWAPGIGLVRSRYVWSDSTAQGVSGYRFGRSLMDYGINYIR